MSASRPQFSPSALDKKLSFISHPIPDSGAYYVQYTWSETKRPMRGVSWTEARQTNAPLEREIRGFVNEGLRSRHSWLMTYMIREEILRFYADENGDTENVHYKYAMADNGWNELASMTNGCKCKPNFVRVRVNVC